MANLPYQIIKLVVISSWTLPLANEGYALPLPKHQLIQKAPIRLIVLPPHPEQASGYFEGDIWLPPSGKYTVNDPKLLWPNGVIPYVIDENYESYWVDLIERSLAEFTYYTCIKFKPRVLEKDYIKIVADNGCASPIGRQTGEQILSLAEECMQRSTIVHELMHSIGFFHEHVRPDRNLYVNLYTDNVAPEHQQYFTILSEDDVTNLNTNYDFKSILHYDAFAFAMDIRKPTLSPIPSNVSIYTLGQSSTLSLVDVSEVAKTYNCSGPNWGGTGENKTVELLDASCNFENSSVCGWTSQTTTSLTWQLHTGETQSLGTGPSGDKTTGKGYYMLMEGSKAGAQAGDNAVIMSPAIVSTSDIHCLDISYHKQGSNSVLRISLFTDNKSYPLHNVTEDQGQYWKSIKLLLLDQFIPNFQIKIEAVRGEDSRSDVAVDDIFITPDFC